MWTVEAEAKTAELIIKVSEALADVGLLSSIVLNLLSLRRLYISRLAGSVLVRRVLCQRNVCQ